MLSKVFETVVDVGFEGDGGACLTGGIVVGVVVVVETAGVELGVEEEGAEEGLWVRVLVCK